MTQLPASHGNSSQRLNSLTHPSSSSLTPESESETYITTDGESESLSWNKAPTWGLQYFYCCQTVTGLLKWGALSDDRASLSFTIAAGPRKRSHSRVRVALDS
jgi:hypothetical protein